MLETLVIVIVVVLVGVEVYRENTRRSIPKKLQRSHPSKKGSYTVEFNGKTYNVSAKKYDLIQRAQQGNKEAQYEIIIEYYEGNSRPKDFIPELCFFYTEQLAQNDLGVLTELGDLYFDGVGTPKDEEKGRATYERALELYDNPPEGVYIPEHSKKYRDFLVKKSQLIEIKK